MKYAVAHPHLEPVAQTGKNLGGGDLDIISSLKSSLPVEASDIPSSIPHFTHLNMAEHSKSESPSLAPAPEASQDVQPQTDQQEAGSGEVCPTLQAV